MFVRIVLVVDLVNESLEFAGLVAVELDCVDLVENFTVVFVSC